MIGSSAAKWIAQISEGIEGRVALVGESEPHKKEEGDIFGAWFDEGRITRVLDRNDAWRLLAEKSIARYRDIEERAGIPFYEEVGFLSLVDDNIKDKTGLENAVKSIRQLGYQCDLVDSSNATEKFPDLNLADELFGYHQSDDSGYINPRQMVKAQKSIAAMKGCKIINEAVKEITKEHNMYQLTLANGKTIKSSNVVLATGAYLNISKYLQHFFKAEVALNLTTQTVAYLRISEEEANRLINLPTMVTTYSSGALDGTYILPQ